MIYVEITTFSLIVLIIIAAEFLRRHSYSPAKKQFLLVVFSTMVILLINLLGWLLNGKQGQLVTVLLYVTNVLYFIFSCLVCYLWFIYVYKIIFYKSCNLKKVAIISAIPLIFLTCVSLASTYTGWIFSIENNLYVRGKLYWFQAIINFAYLFAASFIALFFGKNSTREQRKSNNALATFIILPIIGALFQSLVYGIDIIWHCATISLLSVYFEIQNTTMAMDDLTWLNNRASFTNYLESKCAHYNGKTLLYLIIMDVNDFKMVNDNYGHIVGDEVLIDISSIVSQTFLQSNSFTCRFGGDEISIVYECNSKEEGIRLKSDFDKKLDALNSQGKYPFDVSLSCGYAKYKKGQSTKDFLDSADKMMYEVKQNRKNKEQL